VARTQLLYFRIAVSFSYADFDASPAGDGSNPFVMHPYFSLIALSKVQSSLIPNE